jgi:hypothetical protein
MAKERPSWSKFCKETGNRHTSYEYHKACPDCGALNPTPSTPKEMIEIPDDSPQPKTLFPQKPREPDSTVRFQSYNKNPQAEIVRQTSMQKARNTNQSGTKLTESLRTTVNLWLRTYRVVTKNNFSIEKQVDCSIIERTTVHLRDNRIESLDHFVRNTLLYEISRWKEISKDSDDRLYLATEVHSKEGPVRLPRSADEIRTIKELLLKYFPLKNRTMHVVLEREDMDSYEEEDLSKGLPSIKKEPSVKKEPSIKKESFIKQEKKTIKKELKTKRPPSASYETPKATRARDQSFQNLARTDSESDSDLTDLDDILNLKSVNNIDEENDEVEKETTSPMALRTRTQMASKKGKARA